jgi:5-methylcytosine-specific restriction endonuclease McrA
VVPLDRSGVIEPEGWQERVERALPDAKLFLRKAKAFERLALNGKKRRAGFCAYAGEVFEDGDFPAVWRHDVLKAALEAMTRGCCAYCQASVADSSYAPVEHVLPKALFPLLAFVIANYLYGCQRCNAAKADNWPANGAYVRPDVGEPRVRFVFDEHGRMHAAPGDREAAATIVDFALNRSELQEQRKLAIQHELVGLKLGMEMPGLTEAEMTALARSHMTGRLTRFSEAINQCVRRAWEARFPGVPL